MIRLERDRSPGAVKVGFRGQHKINRERELIVRRLGGDKPRSTVWKGAKEQLRIESGGKCGYCEGKAAHVAHGDVDHFRPKSVYWWLAYCYDNFVYCCQICNQTFKGARFPVRGAPLVEPAVPAAAGDAEIDALAGRLAPDPVIASQLQAFVHDAVNEDPDLPDPYDPDGDPETLFSWQSDPVLGEVEMAPRDGSDETQRSFAAARDVLGLNRDELKRWRWEIYEQAELLGQLVATGSLPPDLHTRSVDRLKAMMSIDGEFAGMVRFLVRDQLGLAL